MIDRRYYFLRSWRQYKTGDPVPDTFESGIIGTMAERGIIGHPKVLAPVKQVIAAPADKMVRSSLTKRKATTV